MERYDSCTVEEDVKTLAKTYMDRIHSNGALGICVLGETAGKSLATRLANAKAYNAPYFITAVVVIITPPEKE